MQSSARGIVSFVAGAVAYEAAWWFMPWPADNPFFVLMRWGRSGLPSNVVYYILMANYWMMWFAGPFLLVWIIGEWIEKMLDGGNGVSTDGRLPIDTPARLRKDIYVTMGEIHHQVKPGPSPSPRLSIIPEKGLYTNTLCVGSIGSSKTTGVLNPALGQLLEHPARIGGLALDPNGDLQRYAKEVMRGCGRSDDFLDINPDGGYTFNPLAGNFDPTSLSNNIAELVANLHGESKEPYWRQSYTGAMSALIRINLLTSDYVTFVDLYECLLNADILQDKVDEVRKQLASQRLVTMPRVAFEASKSFRQTLRNVYGFKWSDARSCYAAPWSRKLMAYLTGPPGNSRFASGAFDDAVYEIGQADPQKVKWLDRFEFWYKNDWEARDDSNRLNVATSVTAFLMPIWDNDSVRELLCPPRAAYEPGWMGRPVLASMDDLIENGRVAGITIPLHWAAGIGRTVNVLAKLNFQLAVQSRMTDEAGEIQPCLLFMDEYPSMATTSERSTVGDDVFFARNTRRGRCIVMAAAQTVEQIKPLVGLFRSQICMGCDPETAAYFSKRCGMVWKRMDSLSVSESNQRSHLSMFDHKLLGSEGGTGLSRSYSPHRVPMFEPETLMGLGRGQAVACLFDGKQPQEPSRLYLRPSYVKSAYSGETYFEKDKAGVI
jgi:hypothetical protein